MTGRRPIALVLCLFAFCSPREPAARGERPPVILISVDTLRSDRLPAYGYQGVATPAIDGLRRDGILYRRAYSHCPLTLPSHLSMFTGLLPTEHGVRNNIGYRFDAARHRTLAETLRAHGYHTGAAVSSYVLRGGTGAGDGFDFYEDAVPVAAGGAASEHQRSGFRTLERAKAWLGARKAEPFFFFFHIYEPHAPYTPPEPYRSRYADPYDGEVATADAIAGELLGALRQSGVYDRALIVFTSDHGEALWEHGEDQHGILLYREVLQVPLIVKLPHSARRGAVEQGPFELRRLFHTILQLTGVESQQQPAPQPVYSETLYPRIHLGWSDLRSLIDGRYHYIDSSSPELYDLERDPAESVNLASSERRVVAAMRRRLEEMPAPAGRFEPVSAEEAAKLAALGYVGTPRERSGVLPNPREEIHVLREIKDAFQLAALRRNDEAVRKMQSLVDRNPRLIDVASRLAEVLLDSGRYDEAIAVYRSAMAQTERFSPDLALALATAYLQAGRRKEAVEHAQLALRSQPMEAHEIIARARLGGGRLEEARQHAAAAIEAGGRQPRSLLLMAELQRAAGALDGALQTAAEAERRARELGITQAGIDHLRGDVLARLGRPGEAIAAYQREIERFPHHLQSYANLAVIHLIEGRRAEAERLLDEMVKRNPHRRARELAATTRRLE